jgi:hypothetical protein
MMNINCGALRLFFAAALLLRITAAVYAEEDGERSLASSPGWSGGGPAVLVQSSPAVARAGSLWTLSILINHAVPEEVTVFAPPFTGSLFLDQVLKGPRLVNPATGQALAEKKAAARDAGGPDTVEGGFERWTAMEYRFMLNGPGIITFNEFTVITPLGRTETVPLAVEVQNVRGTAAARHVRMAWDKVPSGLNAGETAVFGLKLQGSASLLPLPPPGFFMPAVPLGAILEQEQLLPEDLAAGLALRLKLIPLEAAPFVLPGRQISSGNVVFEIPALRVTVGPALQTARNSAAAMEKPEAAKGIAPFPAFESLAGIPSSLFKKHRVNCENIYAAAKSLWERGCHAGALAELRRSERDHPAGSLFTPLRMEAERGLGLGPTKDETARKFPFGGRRPDQWSAVVRATAVRRIPEQAGEEIARFGEGQPVRIISEGMYGGWVRVTAHDESGVSGWVPEAKIILY